MKEGVVAQLKDGSISNGMIENVGVNGFDFEPEFEFWPIQHPSEPSHEDRPIECPISHSSPVINDKRMQDDRFSERKRSEASMVIHKQISALEATEPVIRTVRKRHHDHTNTITPLLQKLPVSHQNMNASVLNKLQQVHRFES
ncbi:hypothetical protein OSB04_008667 [Centaurea solstitialis]|uniref:Uncharacterized protein n=1 Tax=Centaurea solstitialis TaxID=347529 RepID=A0AA38WJP6_9ASTR|nr:hypothetical protein OSB04_008667 [Centaurea solstitialis]